MNPELTQKIHALYAFHVETQRRVEYEKLNLTRLRSKMLTLEAQKVLLVKAVGLIDRCIEIISCHGIGKIESIVSGGLQMVLDDRTVSFILNKRETARGFSYEPLMRQGDFVGKPADCFGGGAVNIIAFLLRIIFIKRFKLAKCIILDEAFNNVSIEGGHLARVSALLKTLCHEHKFDILAVTHQPVLAQAADHVYRITAEEQPRIVLETREEPNGTQEQTAAAQTP